MTRSSSLILVVASALLPSVLAAAPQSDQSARGKKVYEGLCIACHQVQGQGVPGAFPPLAQSDFLMADKARSIRVVAKGLSGKITVNGKTYEGVMPPTGLKPEQIADVLTYVRSEFGNTGDAVTTAEVDAALKSDS